LKRLPAVRDIASVDIKIQTDSGGAVPQTLVNRAIEAKRTKDETDEFWCVFDVEWPQNHPYLKETINLAKTHDIQLAISNPCFEIWLVFHFTDYSASTDNDGARRSRREQDKQNGKALDPDLYMPKRGEAVRRARILEQRHKDNGTEFPKDNPSSGMHLLVSSADPSVL
jgi:hypothetical protein